MVKENSFVTIQAFMVNNLQLKGNELLIYAIIHGFSQDGESEFTGSLQYLADWCNTSKQTIITALQSLCEKQLIIKNVEFKNNVKFCTYKSSGVFKNFDGGSQKSLTGYSKNFNGGSQNSLPNNINNNISNNIKESIEEVCVPSYVPQPLKTNKESFQNFLNDCFLMITDHNKNAKHKIPISKAIMYFTQKEGRELLELSRQYETSEIKNALQNYLKVANSDSWKSGFSFGAFCKNISEYTAEYFDISKYIDAPKNKEDVQAITDAFAEKNKTEKWFDYAILHRHREDWIKAGKPEGNDFIKWADKVYNEDVSNGITY